MVKRFLDRHDAGRQLAAELKHLAPAKPIVLALPRGGVPVGLEIARALEAPLSLLLVRKIGAPGYPEVAIGAIVDGTPPQTVLNEEIIERIEVAPAYLQVETKRQLAELERRRKAYAVEGDAPSVLGRSVIVVDDGIATGSTIKAALLGLRNAGAARIAVAIPVAAPQALEKLRPEADEWVCLIEPHRFEAVGKYYDNFDQLEDADVVQCLREASAPS